MLKYSWIIIYGIFYTAATIISIGKHNGKDKSVNLALETVFEFNEEDKKADVNILNRFQKFIGKVKDVIENNHGGRRHIANEKKNLFTNFLIDVIHTLIQYDDRDLEQFVFIVSDEMGKHHYRGSKFHEIIDNGAMRDVLASKLAKIKKIAAADIRKYLTSLANQIEEEKYMQHEKELLDTINSIYSADSLGKLNRFMTDIDDYRIKARKNIDLSKIISGGLKSILFDHYNNLNVNTRSSVMFKVQDFLKKLYSGFANISTRQINTNPTTITTKELRTLRQMYVEKDLDLKYIKNAYDEWIADSKKKRTTRTQMTQRPFNVPTTRKLISENYSPDSLRSHKKYRVAKASDSKSSDEYTTPKYKKHRAETTREYRTLRQMYVEKNLDLKYDPDAYEHLTTGKIDKTKKITNVRPFNSPTTRKRVKNKYKKEKTTYESDTYEKQLKKQRSTKKHETSDNGDDSSESHIYFKRKDDPVEKVVNNFMIDISTEIRVPTNTKVPKSKVTKLVRHLGTIYLEKDLDNFDDTQHAFRSNSKKLTFMTLYPTIVIDWSKTTPRIAKRNFAASTSKYRVKLSKRGSGEYRNTESKKRDEIKRLKNEDSSVELEKERHLERFRHKKQHHIKENARTRSHSKKMSKQHHAKAPVLRRQDRHSIGGKLKVSRAPLILAKHIRGSQNVGRNQYRRYYSQPSVISHEGFSIETYDDIHTKISSRRNHNPNVSDNVGDNKQVLRRLIKLENDLELVKTKIKNDTNVVKDTNNNLYVNESKSSTIYSGNPKVTQIQERITSLNGTSYFDIDVVSKLKNISTSVFNTVLPEIHNTKNVAMKKPLLNMNKEGDIIETKLDSYTPASESRLKTVSDIPPKALKVSKEDYTLNVDEKDHVRKDYSDLSKIEGIQSDINKNLNNFDSRNDTSINNIYDTSVESKTNISTINENEIDARKGRTEKDSYFRINNNLEENTLNVTAYETLKKKYGSGVTEFKKDMTGNQTEQTLSDNQVETGIEEEKLKRIYEEFQINANFTKDNVVEHVPNLEQQQNSFKDILFRAQTGETTPEVIFKTKQEETSTSREEPTPNSITAADKTVLVTQTPLTNITTAALTSSKAIPDHLVKQLINEIGGHLASSPKHNDGGLKDTTDVHLALNTTEPSSIKHETNQQNPIASNIQMPSNLTRRHYKKDLAIKGF